MRHAIALCLLALLATPIAAGAQEARGTRETTVKSDNGKVVMMVGCVMIGGGTNFTLSNITTEREQDEKTTARTGGPYALVPREGLDLGPYINQKVEMAGVVVPPATKGDNDDKFEIKETTKVEAPNGRDRTSSAATTVKVDRGPMHQFLVASVKMRAPSCDQ
jgi:hypothetical protein